MTKDMKYVEEAAAQRFDDAFNLGHNGTISNKLVARLLACLSVNYSTANNVEPGG